MPDRKLPASYLALITHVGLSMIVPILLGLFLGQWLDKVFKTAGILTIIMLFLGIAAAFRNLLRLGKVYKKGTSKKQGNSAAAELSSEEIQKRGNKEALNPKLSRSSIDLSKLETKSSKSPDEAEIEVEEW